MSTIFFELAVVICLAASLSILFRFFKQPAILAYILTGILIVPFGDIQLQGREFIQTLGEFGITLLLFMVGLELKLKDLQSVGKIAFLTGIGQILFTSLIGYFICLALGFSQIASAYISIALTFSSTIIIVKLLSDKRDLQSLYGKISVGFLLVQDFVAILILIFLSGFTAVGTSTSPLLSFSFVLIKGFLLFAGILFLSKRILPQLVDRIAHSSETLFLFSIAWALGLSALVSSPLVGFSIEIGGFLAGLALANSSESYQIVGKIKPLRDFFITLFFVILGMGMTFTNIGTIIAPALLLSMFVLIGNPIIVMAIMGAMGYRRRTSFLAGLTVAQISEFSLIVIFLGNRIGHVPDNIVSLVTIVGVVTFISSTYMIMHGNKLYRMLGPYLGFFERKHTKEESIKDLGEVKNHVVLIGANRTGGAVLEALLEEKENVVVVDFDPNVVKELEKKSVKSLFGDIADSEIQERALLKQARLVISTISDLEDNLLLLDGLSHHNNKAKVIVVARDFTSAKKLYDAGADYVVVPHFLGGKHLAKMIKDNTLEKLDSRKAVKDLPKAAISAA